MDNGNGAFRLFLQVHGDGYAAVGLDLVSVLIQEGDIDRVQHFQVTFPGAVHRREHSAALLVGQRYASQGCGNALRESSLGCTDRQGQAVIFIPGGKSRISRTIGGNDLHVAFSDRFARYLNVSCFPGIEDIGIPFRSFRQFANGCAFLHLAAFDRFPVGTQEDHLGVITALHGIGCDRGIF